jgi:hypothetical protein
MAASLTFTKVLRSSKIFQLLPPSRAAPYNSSSRTAQLLGSSQGIPFLLYWRTLKGLKRT